MLLGHLHDGPCVLPRGCEQPSVPQLEPSPELRAPVTPVTGMHASLLVRVQVQISWPSQSALSSL